MDERALKQRIRASAERATAGLRDDPWLTERVLAAACTKDAKRSGLSGKRTIIFVIVLALLLGSVTALAITLSLSHMTKRVAELEGSGQLETWGLEAKVAFVTAMRESGYDVSAEDWRILSDTSRAAEEREQAADRIIYDRYGAYQEAANAEYVMPLESVMGQMPDPVQIFAERYMAENPNATELEYTDALGYWLRDEYIPQVWAAQETPAVPTPAQSNTLTQEEACADFIGYMTEVIGLTSDTVNAAELAARQDASSGAWNVTATLPAGKLQQPITNDAVNESENGCILSYWVARAKHGEWCRGAMLEAVSEEAAFFNLYTISSDEGERLAVQAIQSKYQLTDSEVARYFVYHADTYTGDPSCLREGIVLRTHNRQTAPWDYAAIVNMTTGEVEDLFTSGDLFGRLTQLAKAWDKLQEDDEWLQYYRWYATWSPFQAKDWPKEALELATKLFPADWKP